MTMKNNKICAVLGKGIIEMGYGLDEKYHKYIDLKMNMVITISELIMKGYTEFISDAEWGFALWACETLLKMRNLNKLQIQNLNKLQLHLIAPFEEQAAMWSDEARERYYNVHAQCDMAVFLRHRFKKDCYNECDEKIIDECDLLFTDKEYGFAAQYAKNNGKTIITCENSDTDLLLL